ncbi:MAG: MerR family transcriptional regulator [Eubacteriales bacterium]|nr:MerR family transcriptional regulator [Eubacteriales bacterium]
MKINEVMKETGLTKKAIYYYEKEGLIKPQKDPENNYRNYTKEEVKNLIIINILRRLDVPVKAIGDLIADSVSMKDVLKEQLVITNHKINMLFQNKKIMNELILQDADKSDLSFSTLKKFKLKTDKLFTVSGQAGDELELIFPGTLGKTFAIFYRNVLNVPLDSDEKISAWNELVSRLDEMKEIEFPEEIQKIVEALYSEMEDDIPSHWKKVSRQMISEITTSHTSPDQTGILLAKEALVGYYANPDNQKKIEGLYMLQSFIIKNPDMFLEIEKFIRLLE